VWTCRGRVGDVPGRAHPRSAAMRRDGSSASPKRPPARPPPAPSTVSCGIMYRSLMCSQRARIERVRGRPLPGAAVAASPPLDVLDASSAASAAGLASTSHASDTS